MFQVGSMSSSQGSLEEGSRKIRVREGEGITEAEPERVEKRLCGRLESWG